eukprot:2011172-Rhodomonas_salina.1
MANVPRVAVTEDRDLTAIHLWRCVGMIALEPLLAMPATSGFRFSTDDDDDGDDDDDDDEAESTSNTATKAPIARTGIVLKQAARRGHGCDYHPDRMAD